MNRGHMDVPVEKTPKPGPFVGYERRLPPHRSSGKADLSARGLLGMVCTALSITVLLGTIWWQIRTGGVFIEGCGPAEADAYAWNQIGVALRITALAGLPVSALTLWAGHWMRGLLGLAICGSAFAWILFANVKVC